MSSPAQRSPHVEHRDPRVLQAGIFVGDVADLSRAALVAFLRLGTEGAAERTHLATWLFGPYLDALTAGHRSLGETEPSLVLGDDAAPEETVGLRIASATYAIQRVLVAFAADPDLSVATRLVERGVVEPVIDERGARGYAPRGGQGIPLPVRVLSLVAAELLTRPERLRDDLVVGPAHIEIAERAVVSGIAMRSRQTLPYKPEREGAPSSPGWPGRAPTLAELAAAQDDDEDVFDRGR